MTRLDPIATRDAIEAAYGRYLRSVMRTNDPAINEAIRNEWTRLGENVPLVAGPILESSPPFRPGPSIRDMVAQGTLSQSWLQRRMEHGLPIDRPLYAHQSKAAEHVVGRGRNLVVATGTGSGKTEAFLIPVIDALLREQEAGTLGPGVRALLLYPMNALANDQLKRLRELLADCPEITFGRYTSETKDTHARAEAARRDLRLPPARPNELISRDEMQRTPPHILLTNYAMLEYLLMRPGDRPLFEHDGRGWQFVVLDEVHSYDGALALELGMLMRRLLDRVGRAPSDVRFIGTSATLGSGEGSFPQVATFASNLFGSIFEYVPGDPSRRDVLGAERLRLELPPPDASMTLADALAEGDATTRSEKLLAIPGAQALLRGIADRPRRAEDLAREIFPGQPGAVSLTTALVDALATHRRPGEDHPILSARYHTFVRAIEGPSICLRPHGPSHLPRISLVSDRHCPDCGEDAPMAELATCRRCNQWYVRGQAPRARLERADGLDDTQPDGSPSSVRYFAPIPGEFGSADDDDEINDGDQTASGDAVELVACTYCWQLGDASPGCACPSEAWKHFRMAPTTTTGQSIRCVNCGVPSSTSGPRRLRLGSDAPPAVLASTLYDNLPASPDGDAGKFISFADSRQDAAFFASYLERTYGAIDRRRLVLRALRQTWAAAGGPVRLEDVASALRKLADVEGHFDERESAYAQLARARSWLLWELSSVDRRQSLDGVALTLRQLVRPREWKAPAEMRAEPWKLDDDEAWQVIQTLLGTLVDSQVVSFPEGVEAAWPLFAPRNRLLFVCEDHSSPKHGISSWVPAREASENRRSDYLARILARNGYADRKGQRAYANALLRFIWKGLVTPRAKLADYVVATHEGAAGVRYQANYAYWEWANPASLLRCSHCGLWAGGAVRGVCPTMRCEGTLKPQQPDPDDHYRGLYEAPGAGRMVVEEHTAQWNAAQAALIQQRFLDGDVNILSCSTTFELGVDVGDLQTVFLRNIPPSAANYVQRAGRAGRRRESVAFVLSYAQLRPHDQHMFRTAEQLVSGNVPVPRVPGPNAPIVRRHVHSVALSRFFREVLPPGDEAWKTTGRFFLDGDGEALARFRVWLASEDSALQAELLRVVPAALHGALGVANWAWAKALLAEDSPLARAEADIAQDQRTYKGLMDEASQAQEFGQAGYFKRVLSTIRDQYLLGFLASRNVMPKYGFPVDVVELKTQHLTAAEATQLELDRDLRVAISEYAPGAGVVAAKRLWMSTGLRLLPNKALPKREYGRCDNCHRIDFNAADRRCSLCGGDIRRDFPLVDPVFGFVADEPDKRALGDERPPRLHSSEVLFAGLSEGAQGLRVMLAASNGETLLTGRVSRNGSLAVVNDARRRGFALCERCGFAMVTPVRGEKWPRPHAHPELRRPCNGRLEQVTLGHTFQTDIVEFGMPGFVAPGEDPAQRAASRVAVVTVLAEGAARALQLRREDLETTYYIDGSETVFVLYDNVPGGAGLAREVFSSFADVFVEALNVVGRCTCGADSSCYGCIRTYRNQPHHDHLDRGFVASTLQSVIDVLRPA
ncbi:MAG: DEAD/DEAH box helicase [Dehalococcoidia bacterium]